MATSDWISKDNLVFILAALTLPNRLACLASLKTGLRIGDVLALKTEDVKKQRFTIKEEKTGKARRIRLPSHLCTEILAQAGRIYCFEGRYSVKSHRTRQAVYKDINRAAAAFRLREHISPHSMRKSFAVDYFKRSNFNLQKTKNLLNHSSEAVTMLYAMADVLTKEKIKKYSVLDFKL